MSDLSDLEEGSTLEKKMNSTKSIITIVVISCLFLLAGCGGGSPSTSSQETPNPAPSIASLSPARSVAGSASFTLTVNGSNFVQGATVQWNGSSRSTTFASATQLTAAISAADIAAAGTAQVTVANPTPGGGTSNSLPFTITSAANPIPTLSSLSPSSAVAGSSAFTLTVNGSNFVQGATVQWNGSSRSTTFASATQLTAAISAADIAAVGSVQVTVANPTAGGGTSNSLTFTITASNPAPTLGSLAPISAKAGNPAFTLTVNGSSFVEGSTVQWNGNDRNTTFVSAAQLTASINASDISSPGTAQVTVSNPTPGGGQSAAAVFFIDAIQLASLAVNGSLPNNESDFSATSTTGRYVAFDSIATNLVATPDQDNAVDTFLRDTCLHVASKCAPTTVLVSSDTNGNPTGGSNPAISADGRYVAFKSVSTAIVATPTNGKVQVYVRDTCIAGTVSGCTPTTTLVSVSSDGTTGGNNDSTDNTPAAISADGRYIAFDSTATNLVASGTSGVEIVFLRDACIGAPSGCVPQTIIVSMDNSGNTGAGMNQLPTISDDGRFVAFSTGNAFDPNDNNNYNDIYVRDTCVLGSLAGCTPTTLLVSLTSANMVSNANNAAGADHPSISGTGRFISFSSNANDMAPNITGKQNVFVRDTCFGVAQGCTPSTSIVSVSSTGAQTVNSSEATISDDGRFVTFLSDNLVPNDTNNFQDIYVRDTCLSGTLTGCTPSTVQVSVAVDGSAANAATNFPHISPDGHWVTFSSAASNLVVPNPNNAVPNIFLAPTSF